DARGGKRGRERLLELLRAEPFEHEARLAALRAAWRRWAGVAAVVARERPAGAPVERERDGAGGARGHLAAGMAAHARREAAAVQEEDRLLPLRERLLDGAMQREAEPLVARGACPH